MFYFSSILKHSV